MPGEWASLTSKPDIIAAALVALAAVVALGRLFLNRKPTPEELERRRRTTLYRNGKLGDGEIVDVEPASLSIVFSYTVAGVVYTASQDALALRSLLPQDPMSMLGPVSIRFDPRNPANSIVICEDWSGLRRPSKTALPVKPKV